ncbi:MAG: hypothetical protein GXP48_08305, partial [Acidobacteria bacterium]|nr:hypothetical protein [Acidobacteriota bacterium]
GEDQDRCLIDFGLRWIGSATWDTGFDALRRASRRGHALETELALALGRRMSSLGAEDTLAEVEELAITGRPLLMVIARGAGYGRNARLVLSGLGSRLGAAGQQADTTLFTRELPGAAVLDVSADGGGFSAEVGLVAVPVDGDGNWVENGYQVQLHGLDVGDVDLSVVIVMPDGSTRRFEPGLIPTAAQSLAFMEIDPSIDTAELHVDSDGDGMESSVTDVPVVIQGRPAPRLLRAVFGRTLQPPDKGAYRRVLLLFSQIVDSDAVQDLELSQWTVDSHLELPPGNPTLTIDRTRSGEQLVEQIDPHFLVFLASAPLNPHAQLTLSTGSEAVPFLGGGSLDLTDEPIEIPDDLPTGAARGVVIAGDGNVVPGALVELYEAQYLCFPNGCTWILTRSDSVTADSNGRFVFDAVRFRDGQIPVGHAAFLIRALDPATSHEARSFARLPGDGEVRELTVTMVGRGDVVGTLVRDDGAPLNDPVIEARSATNPEEHAVGNIAADGSFLLRDLPVGPVQIAARDGDAFVYATAVIPGPGQQARVDIVLPTTAPPPTGDVEGTVVSGETGDPLPGIKVYVVPESAGGAVAVATTRSDGTFSISAIPAGPAWFKAWDPERKLSIGEREKNLLADTTNEVQIVTTQVATASVEGTVYHNVGGSRTPAAGVWVVEAEGGHYSITDDQGHYRLDELLLGSVFLAATDPGTGEGVSRMVTLTAQGQVLTVDLDLGEASGTIQGTVVDRAGNPVGGAHVADSFFGGGHETYSVRGGSFVLTGLRPGNHVLLVSLDERLGRGNATILYNGDVAQTTLVLGGLVSMEVRTIADTQGGGTADVLSQLEFSKPGLTSMGKIGRMPKEGWYPCVQGDPSAQCYIDDEGHGHITDLPEGVGFLTVRATNAFYGQVSKSEDLDPGDDGQTITINFSAPGSIAGRVLEDQGGQLVPVDGATVQLWVTNSDGGLMAQQLITTGPDGGYFFDLVNHGGFRIDAAGPSGSGDAGIGWVGGSIASAQAITGLDIVLRKNGGVHGRVAVCTAGNAPSSPGDMVHVELRATGAPQPFFMDGDPASAVTPPALQQRALDVDLSTGEEFNFVGLAAGSWSLRASNPLHGTKWMVITVPSDGSLLDLGDPICLHPTGISGTVVWPGTGDPVPDAVVQLFLGNYVLTAETTGADGSFSFNDLPVDTSYSVAALDPGSNRGGTSSFVHLCDASDPGFGTTCFRTYQIQVALQPLGIVEGTLRTADGNTVPNAFVRLRTRVVRDKGGAIVSSFQDLMAFTDAGGNYSFGGVPAGSVQLEAFDPASPLFVSWGGVIDPLADPTTTVDLELPPVTDLTVRVLDPTGQPLPESGDPVVAFQQHSSHFREPFGSGVRLDHLVQGSPTTFSGVVEGNVTLGSCFGQCFNMKLKDVLDHHFPQDLGASSTFTMPDPPSAQVVDLQLVGRASVQVTVLDGNGDPAEGADVMLSGNGFYGGVTLISQTDASGLVGPFEGIGVGSYTVAATRRDASGNTIRGVSQVAIAQTDNGQTIPVEVSLESAGSAFGTVIDASGAPAPGALVSMSFMDGSTRRLFQTVTDETGAFSFPALPSGHSYDMSIAEGSSGWGVYRTAGINIDTDPVDLGTLQLDNSNPHVAAVDPSNGSSHVASDRAVVLDFTELMRHESLGDGRIVLRHGGQTVGVTQTVEDLPDPDGDGPLGPFTRVTLDHAPLESNTLYLVDVKKGVEDGGGRTLAADFHSTFQTADTVPPRITMVDPPDNPNGDTPVGPDVEPLVTFSEIIDPASVDETTVRLLDAGGADVTVQRVVVGGGFSVELRPDAGLQLDSFYTLAISGVTDASGNPMADSFTSTFRVRDAEPPVVTLLPPTGATVNGESWTAVEGVSLVLRAAVASNDAVASVAFSVDGAPVAGTAVLDPASGEYRQGWTVPAGLGQRMLGVQASDVSGNLSPAAQHPLTVADDAPPSGTLTASPAAEILPNHVLHLTVDAQDDRGLVAAHFTLTGVIAETRDLSFPQGTSGQVVTSFRTPADASAGSQVVVNCTVEDTFGQSTPLTPITVTVLADTEPPVVTTMSPAPGATVTSGDMLTFSFDLADNVAGDAVTLTVDGEPQTVQLTGVVEPGDQWTAHAEVSWQAPEVTQSTDVPYTLTVTDPAGHSTEATGTVTVEPLVNSDAPVVTIGCPADGDPALADTQLTVSFTITDDEKIQKYNILVNGTPVLSDVTVNAAELTATYDWTPPADANPGDGFIIRIEASDYAGNTGADQ